MDYEDFYDLATYANENWGGKFTEREIAGSAYIYKTDYDALGTDSPVIKSMLEVLEDDGTEEAFDWIRRMTQ